MSWRDGGGCHGRRASGASGSAALGQLLSGLAGWAPGRASRTPKRPTEGSSEDEEDDDADEYCDNGGSDVSSDIAGTVNHGSGVGWCMSTLDEKVGCTASPAECWATCEGAHGDGLVAIDWYADGSCWCQNDCQCMVDFFGTHRSYLITRDSAVAALPVECEPSPSSASDLFAGIAVGAGAGIAVGLSEELRVEKERQKDE